MFTVPALDTFITCEVLSNPVTLFLAPFIKPNKRLSLNQKKKAFSLSNDLKEILVGLLLGDIHGRCRMQKKVLV